MLKNSIFSGVPDFFIVRKYSPETKQQVLKKLMPPSNLSVMQISRDTGIPAPTLYSCKNKFQSQGFVVSAKIHTGLPQ